MKNVFKYLGIAARFVIDVIAALRAKREGKKDSEQTLENLKRLYDNNGYDLSECSISMLRTKAAQVLHFAQVIIDYYHGQRSTDDWFVRRFAHFANLDLTLGTFLAAQIAIENFDEAVYRYLEDMEEHQEEFDKISQL